MPFVSSYGNYYPEWTVQFVLGLLQYSPTEHKGKIGVYYHWLATRQPVTGVTGLSTFMNHQDHPCPGSNLRFLYYCIMWTSSHMYCGLQFTRWEFIKFPPGFFQVAIGSWSLYHPCNLTTQIIRLDGQKPATCIPKFPQNRLTYYWPLLPSSDLCPTELAAILYIGNQNWKISQLTQLNLGPKKIRKSRRTNILAHIKHSQAFWWDKTSAEITLAPQRLSRPIMLKVFRHVHWYRGGRGHLNVHNMLQLSDFFLQ